MQCSTLRIVSRLTSDRGVTAMLAALCMLT
jgi:hypothetical protein